MRATFVGTGDAFATGGRAHTCIRLDAGGRTLLVDLGAGAIVGWRRLGFSFNEVDAILLTHLHGDHFGGLPFLMLEAQFIDPRTKPLVIAGPTGTRDRLATAMETLFPGTSNLPWRFDFRIEEHAPPAAAKVAGFDVRTVAVDHAAGAPATGVRVTADGRTFGYSGDTAWTENLIDLARGADVFVCECSLLAPSAPGHMDWPRLRENLPRLGAKRTFLTHMGAEVLAQQDAICAEGGVEAAYDGLVVDL